MKIAVYKTAENLAYRYGKYYLVFFVDGVSVGSSTNSKDAENPAPNNKELIATLMGYNEKEADIKKLANQVEPKSKEAVIKN